MKSGLFASILLVITAFGASGEAQIQPVAGEQSTAIRITAPRQNLRQTANFVDLRYELTNPTAAAAASPDFKIQVDSNDPVTTTATQQSFTGLAAGSHVVTIQLVDANGTVVPTTQNGCAAPPNGSQGASAPHAKAVISPRVIAQNLEDSLPPASSSLPILSIVGFGVLVGGIISAMRTR